MTATFKRYVSTAYQMSSPENIPGGFDPARLRRIGRELVELVASPEFIKHVQAVFEVEESARLTEAANRLTPTALRQAGLPVPQFTRMTSRYFEEGRANDEVRFTDTEAGKDILQVLHERQKGILDKIRLDDEELWRRLNSNDPFPLDPVGPRAGACACVGGGPGWSVCVGGGL
jgi:hypothetical protein